MEQEIIEKIKMTISKITELSSNEIHFKLDRYVKSILENILELIKIEKDDNKIQTYESIWKALDYVNERQVGIAKLAYDKAKKKNAPKIREFEYRSELIEAIRLVEFELSPFTN